MNGILSTKNKTGQVLEIVHVHDLVKISTDNCYRLQLSLMIILLTNSID